MNRGRDMQKTTLGTMVALGILFGFLGGCKLIENSKRAVWGESESKNAVGQIDQLGTDVLEKITQESSDSEADNSDSEADSYEKCDISNEHQGFGGRLLERQEISNVTESNRYNLKGFDGLMANYERLGLNQDCLRGAEAAFGSTPARWFEPQKASSVTLTIVHSSNFCAAEEWVGQNASDLGKPTVETANKLCTTFIADACMAEARDFQVSACADLILVGASDENNSNRRYAHGLAAVLSSACVLTY